MSEDRAVSDVVGFVLSFAVILSSVALISTSTFVSSNSSCAQAGNVVMARAMATPAERAIGCMNMSSSSFGGRDGRDRPRATARSAVQTASGHAMEPVGIGLPCMGWTPPVPSSA